MREPRVATLFGFGRHRGLLRIRRRAECRTSGCGSRLSPGCWCEGPPDPARRLTLGRRISRAIASRRHSSITVEFVSPVPDRVWQGVLRGRCRLWRLSTRAPNTSVRRRPRLTRPIMFFTEPSLVAPCCVPGHAPRSWPRLSTGCCRPRCSQRPRRCAKRESMPERVLYTQKNSGFIFFFQMFSK